MLSYSFLLLCVTLGTFNFVQRFMLDVQAPLVIHSIQAETRLVKQGGTVFYSALYSKRANCYPPRGTGEVRYRFETLATQKKPSALGNLIWENVEGIRRADWPPGDRLFGQSAAAVPIGLPPGKYTLTPTAIYSCANAPHLLQTVVPSMDIEVVPAVEPTK